MSSTAVANSTVVLYALIFTVLSLQHIPIDDCILPYLVEYYGMTLTIIDQQICPEHAPYDSELLRFVPNIKGDTHQKAHFTIVRSIIKRKDRTDVRPNPPTAPCEVGPAA